MLAVERTPAFQIAKLKNQKNWPNMNIFSNKEIDPCNQRLDARRTVFQLFKFELQIDAKIGAKIGGSIVASFFSSFVFPSCLASSCLWLIRFGVFILVGVHSGFLSFYGSIWFYFLLHPIYHPIHHRLLRSKNRLSHADSLSSHY